MEADLCWDLLMALKVLILIIMEDTHGGIQNSYGIELAEKVLILIIMEDTHGDEVSIDEIEFTPES